MIHFFGDAVHKVFAVQTTAALSQEDINKLTWLFGNRSKINVASLDAFFYWAACSDDYAMEHKCN